MKTKSKSLRVSFDTKNERRVEEYSLRTTDTGNQKAVVQAVVDALSLRLTAAKKYLADAGDSAAAAAAALTHGQMATQSVINGMKQAQEAEKKAQEIRETMLALYDQSHKMATQVIIAARELDTFARAVTVRKSKNDYTSDNVVNGISEMQTAQETALESALAAVQSCMVTLAKANEAEFAARMLFLEGYHLLQIMLPKPELDGAQYYEKITNLMHCSLYDSDTVSVGQLATELDDQYKGLLYLLNAMSAITASKNDLYNDLYTQVSMELNEAQQQLDQKTREYASLQAAVNAATAAV